MRVRKLSACRRGISHPTRETFDAPPSSRYASAMQLRLSRNSAAKSCPLGKTARRVLAASFLFFLIKGLIWLAVGGAVLWGVL